MLSENENQHTEQKAEAHDNEEVQAEIQPAERIRWNVSDGNRPVDWDLFKIHARELFLAWEWKYSKWAVLNDPTRITREQLEQCWRAWLETVMKLADEHVGVARVKPNSKMWWNMCPGIHGLHREYKAALKRKRKNDKQGNRILPHIHAMDSARC